MSLAKLRSIEEKANMRKMHTKCVLSCLEPQGHQYYKR